MLKASALFAVLVAVATMPGINAIQPGQADLQDPPEALANPYPTGGGVNSNENSGNSGGGDEGGKLVIAPTKDVDPSYLKYLPAKDKAPAPTGSKRMIHPIGRPDLCLRVQGGEFIEGATVGISYCLDDLDKTKVWQQWEGDIEKNGVLSITDGDKTFCLGGGQGRYDATRPRLMQCGETDEARRAVNGVAFKSGDNYQVKMTGDGSGETYCLDIREQSAQYHGTNWISERDVQIWVCADKDEPKGNQAWTMQRKDGSMAGDAKNRPDDYGRRRRSRV